MTFSIAANAQQERLRIGDRIPALQLQNVWNYKSEVLNLAEFKGKALVIDFWSHACLACLKSFPRLDSLQKQFGDRLQIILVNKESCDSTVNFFRKKNKLTVPAIPMVTGDTMLNTLFPKEGYPYTVWIDAAFVVKHMTHGYNVESENLQQFVQGKSLELKSATREKTYGTGWGYGNKKKMMANLGYYSYISRCIDDLDVGQTELSQRDDSTITISGNCLSIVDLYKKAYRELNKHNFNAPGSVVLKVDDPYRYQRPPTALQVEKWAETNSYSYELVLPLANKEQAYKIMQQDLERYFNLKARVVKMADGTLSKEVLIIEK